MHGLSLLLRLAALIGASCALAGAAVADAPAPAQPISAADAAALLAALDSAADQGLPAVDTKAMRAQLASPDPAVHAQGEARLAAAAVAYARAERSGQLAADRFPNNWAIRPGRYDAQADFGAARAGQRLAAWVASLPPPDPRYRGLVDAHSRYAAIVARGGWPRLATSPGLKADVASPAVRLLMQRLAVEDPTVVVPGAASPVFDAAVSAAVGRAQDRYGLDATGVVDTATLAALNVPADERLAQIRASLERSRWMPRDIPGYRIELNIAAQELTLFDGGAPAMVMRAIVGRPNRQTPTFRDALSGVVFNPPWNVPADIAEAEIWPKARRDAGYLARHHYVVRAGGGLQQLPGPDCALGAIKFELSNRFGVYMHDTPTKSLFTRDLRLFSHGCMRLEHPADLAKQVLQDNPDWPPSRIDDAIEAGATVRAPLRHPVTVFVIYSTAFVDDQGSLAFRADAYKWDSKLIAMLPH
ncbi:MAG TPA: L,D-transpeptidase family protein [Caulobacteraceae bacterium]|nr:L,D-transpeptidase family protein [Caulobacteraceae bacterium]